MLKKYKAVFFDMDGVVIDSMPYHFISWFEALKKYDVRVTPGDIFEVEGAKWETVIKKAFDNEKKTVSAEVMKKISAERNILFKKNFKRYIFKEIPEILANLKKQGLMAGLVTGSKIDEAKKMLPKEIYDIFDTRVAGDMVKRGKPYPDPYLKAAKNLGIAAEKCLVVENAPYGIRSAKTAGMYCIAVTTSLSKECLKLADKILKNHAALKEYFKK